MSIAKALLDFQKAAPDLHRDSENPHFRSKFLSLEGLFGKVLPIANEHGLVIQQWVTTLDGQPALRTRITHAESGESTEDVMLLHAKPDPQSQGSAITYARRYSLMAALGLVADEDDDGNGAGAPDAPPSSASDNPAEQAHQAYLEASAKAQAPGAKPSDQLVHFGKNKGVRLGDMTPQQVKWYAESWKLQETPSEYDHRLKEAAVALNAGRDSFEALLDVPDDDLPF